MSAIKKSDPTVTEQDSRESDARTGAQLEDVSNTHDLEGTDSPVRRMQAELEGSISDRSDQSRSMDIGRVLAVSSGITTLLGVFIFSGIW